jgi:hypothetical protein
MGQMLESAMRQKRKLFDKVKIDAALANLRQILVPDDDRDRTDGDGTHYGD